MPPRLPPSILQHIRSYSTAPPPLPTAYHIFAEPLPYLIGLKLQNDIIDRRLEAKARDPESSVARQDVVLLHEHLPTYTTGRRDCSPNPDTLHPEEKKVQNVGADFYITKRGGQVTYHGPGQLVGYPIFDLNAMDISTRCYVAYVQSLLAEYLDQTFDLNVLAPHPDGHVGVFANPHEKLASIGIHLRHRITSHGFSLNVTPEPTKWFDLVLACGLADVKATSISQTTQTALHPNLSVKRTAEDLMPFFAKKFGREFVPLHQMQEGEGVDMLKELIGQAERDSAAEIGRKGRWRSEPDLRGRTDLPAI